MRLHGIDFLRGLAVTPVIVYHFYILFDFMGDSSFQYLHLFGQIGVSLFFVISGFLIYRSVEHSFSTKHKKEALTYYTLHRLFRILPAYYVNLIFVVILFVFLGEGNLSYLFSLGFIKNLITHLTFSSYFLYQDTGFGINGAYWTLHIEMLWYIFVPILFIYLRHNLWLIFLFCLSILYLLSIDLGWITSLFHLNPKASNYTLILYFFSFQLPGQLIYFIMGIAIYKSKISIRLPLIFKLFAFILILLLFIYFSTLKNDFLESFILRNSVLLACSTLLFILFYHVKIRWMQPIEWLGKISYSLYLWHMPILYVMHKLKILSFLSLYSTLVLFIAILLSISSLSYYFIEEGGFKLRKKMENSL